MKKALLVASIFGFINAFEKNDIKILQSLGYSVTVATNMLPGLRKSGDTGQLNEFDIEKVQIDFSRSPFSKQTLIAYKQLKKLINNKNFDIIHCHTPVAGILTRIAARKERKKGTKVIYTAHGFHFFKSGPIINWLIYYPLEKICSYFTDVLITINNEDYQLAKKKMKAKKIEYIPGVGLDIKKFASVKIDKDQKRQELGITSDDIMLLSVGEINKRKNHSVIIKALANLENKNIHYFIAGIGHLQDYLINLSKELNIQNNVHILGFRNDIGELCKVADIFCFPSLQEGLPVALMEAMAIGLPCIISNIRGNIDLIKNDIGGYLVNPKDINLLSTQIKFLSNNIDIRKNMSENNKESIKEFDINNVSKIMQVIYK